MDNKKIFLLFSIILVITILSISVNAQFTPEHEFETIYSCQNGHGAIVDQCCGTNMQLLIDGDAGADIFVVHYVDPNTVGSYIATHTRGNYLNCLQWAGTDKDLQCYCYGMGLHQSQDILFHTNFNGTNGLVPTYLQRTFSSNLGGHMAIENDFDIKFQDYYKSDPILSSGQLKIADNGLFTKTMLLNVNCNTLTGTNKFLELSVKISGLTLSQVRQDACTFSVGYKGNGFKDTAYGNNKLNLPTSWWLVAVVLVIIGLFGIFAVYFIPRLLNKQPNWWIIFYYILFGFLTILAILLLLSMIFNFSWLLVRTAVSFLPISVSQNDIIKYTAMEKTYSVNFIQSANIVNDQNSGLAYYDRNNQLVNGALAQGEWTFLFLALPFYAFSFLYLIIWILFKAFRKSPITSKALKIYNITGYILLGIVALLFVYIMFVFFSSTLPGLLKAKAV